MTEAYVTLVVTEAYASGALVLAHKLRELGSVKEIVCLITPNISSRVREQLSQVLTVIEVDELRSNDHENLQVLGRPELDITFTKIQLWKLTQYSKIVFLDADTLPLRNVDDLFDRPAFSAAPDAGWPDCFNSGVFVAEPSDSTYDALIELSNQKGSFDGGDQGLLNTFFNTWSTLPAQRLPFTYNTTPTAQYGYAPAQNEFGHSIAIMHFIGPNKPWTYQRFSDGSVYPRGDTWDGIRDMLQNWWDTWDRHYGRISPYHLLSGNFDTPGFDSGFQTRPILPFDETIENAWESQDYNPEDDRRQVNPMPPLSAITISQPAWIEEKRWEEESHHEHFNENHDQQQQNSHHYEKEEEYHHHHDEEHHHHQHHNEEQHQEYQDHQDHHQDQQVDEGYCEDHHQEVHDESHKEPKTYSMIEWNPAYQDPPKTGSLTADIPDLSYFKNAWDRPVLENVWVAPLHHPEPQVMSRPEYSHYDTKEYEDAQKQFHKIYHHDVQDYHEPHQHHEWDHHQEYQQSNENVHDGNRNENNYEYKHEEKVYEHVHQPQEHHQDNYHQDNYHHNQHYPEHHQQTDHHYEIHHHHEEHHHYQEPQKYENHQEHHHHHHQEDPHYQEPQHHESYQENSHQEDHHHYQQNYSSEHHHNDDHKSEQQHYPEQPHYDTQHQEHHQHHHEPQHQEQHYYHHEPQHQEHHHHYEPQRQEHHHEPQYHHEPQQQEQHHHEHREIREHHEAIKQDIQESNQSIIYPPIFPWESKETQLPPPTRIWMDEQTLSPPPPPPIEKEEEKVVEVVEEKHQEINHYPPVFPWETVTDHFPPPTRIWQDEQPQTHKQVESPILVQQESITNESDQKVDPSELDEVISYKSEFTSEVTDEVLSDFAIDSSPVQNKIFDFIDKLHDPDDDDVSVRDLIPIHFKSSSRLNSGIYTPSSGASSRTHSRSNSRSSSRRASIVSSRRSSVSRKQQPQLPPALEINQNVKPTGSRLFAAESSYYSRKTPYTSAAVTPAVGRTPEIEKQSYFDDDLAQASSPVKRDFLNMSDYSLNRSIEKERGLAIKEEWNPSRALRKLKAQSESMVLRKSLEEVLSSAPGGTHEVFELEREPLVIQNKVPLFESVWDKTSFDPTSGVASPRTPVVRTSGMSKLLQMEKDKYKQQHESLLMTQPQTAVASTLEAELDLGHFMDASLYAGLDIEEDSFEPGPPTGHQPEPFATFYDWDVIQQSRKKLSQLLSGEDDQKPSSPPHVPSRPLYAEEQKPFTFHTNSYQYNFGFDETPRFVVPLDIYENEEELDPIIEFAKKRLAKLTSDEDDTSKKSVVVSKETSFDALTNLIGQATVTKEETLVRSIKSAETGEGTSRYIQLLGYTPETQSVGSDTEFDQQDVLFKKFVLTPDVPSTESNVLEKEMRELKQEESEAVCDDVLLETLEIEQVTEEEQGYTEVSYIELEDEEGEADDQVKVVFDEEGTGEEEEEEEQSFTETFYIESKDEESESGAQVEVISIKDVPIEEKEVPVEVTPVEEVPIEEEEEEDEEIHVEVTSVEEEIPIEVTSTEEVPIEKVSVEEEIPVEVAFAEEVPVEVTSVEEVPIEKVPVEKEVSVEVVSAEKAPIEVTSTEEVPIEEAFAKEEISVEIISTEEVSIKQALDQEIPTGEAFIELTATEEEEIPSEITSVEEAPVEATIVEEKVPPQATSAEEVSIEETSIKEVVLTEEMPVKEILVEETALEALNGKECLVETSISSSDKIKTDAADSELKSDNQEPEKSNSSDITQVVKDTEATSVSKESDMKESRSINQDESTKKAESQELNPEVSKFLVKGLKKTSIPVSTESKESTVPSPSSSKRRKGKQTSNINVTPSSSTSVTETKQTSQSTIPPTPSSSTSKSKRVKKKKSQRKLK